MEDYGLTEGEADPKTYPKRTRKNVEDADGTVLFGDTNSPGSKLTLSHAKKIGKPYIANPAASDLRQWIIDNDIETLNIAGNRKIDESKTAPLLREALGIEAPIEAPAEEVHLWSEEDQTVYTADKVWKDSMPAATPEQIAKYPVKPLPEEAPAKPDAEDKAMAKSMGLSVEDYMKTLAVSEKKAPVKKKATPEELTSPESQKVFESLPQKFTSPVDISRLGVDIKAGIEYSLEIKRHKRLGTSVNYMGTMKAGGLTGAMSREIGPDQIFNVSEIQGMLDVLEEIKEAPAEKKAPKLDVKKMDVEFASNQGHGYSLVSEAREGEVTDRIKDKTIIDLGAGQTFPKYKKEMITKGAKNVIGIDPNLQVGIADGIITQDDMLSYLQKQPDNSIDVVTMNAIEFGEKFAIITGKDAIIYQKEVFKEIERTVKPGGSLIGSSTTDFIDIPGWNKVEDDAAVIYDKPAAPAKKKTKEPLAVEKADKLIDDIIGAPKVNAKTKRKLDSIQKESKTKADDAISKAEEIDSTTDDINDKLDEDLCI